MIVGEILVQLKFIVANVPSPLIGPNGMDFKVKALHTCKSPYIEEGPQNEQLLKSGSHLYVAAMVIPGLHNPDEIIWDGSVGTRYTPSSQLIIGEVDDLSNQAHVPRQLRQLHQPTTLTTIEMAEHSLTHMPYRSWCPFCVKARGH
eukprot:4585980-Amphidinium_carterae.3